MRAVREEHDRIDAAVGQRLKERLLRVRVARPYGESTAARILRMVEESAAVKAKSEAFITRFAAWYTPIVVGLALLIALEVVLTRFLSINLPIVRIGFGFLPVAIAAILFGPLWAGIGYAVGDLIGMLIWPTGAYFPGFTLVAVVVLAYSLVLNTVWLSMLYGKALWGLLPTRILQCVILIPVQVLTIKLVCEKILPRLGMAPVNINPAPEDTPAA